MTRAPNRTRSPRASASGCRYRSAHSAPVGYVSASGGLPAGRRQQLLRGRVDQLTPAGEQPHVMPLPHRAPADGPASSTSGARPALQQVRGRGQPDRPRTDHHHRQLVRHPSTSSIDAHRSNRVGLYRRPSIDATIDVRRYSAYERGPALHRAPVSDVPTRAVCSASRGGDLRGVVRLPGRPDPGAAAARRRRRRARGARRGAGRAARHQPVHVLPPRPQARRRRVRRRCARTAPPPSSRSTPPAAPDCRTPPTSSWACSRRGPCCPTTCPPTSPSARCEPGDWAAVRRIYAEGIATGDATFETEVPDRRDARPARGCPTTAGSPRLDGQVVGWAALPRRSPPGPSTPASPRPSIYVGDGHRGRGVGQSAPPPPGHRRRRRPACGPCRPRSSPRTAPASPCTTPPATAPSASANASADTTASGATPSSSNAAAPPTPTDSTWTVLRPSSHQVGSMPAVRAIWSV